MIKLIMMTRFFLVLIIAMLAFGCAGKQEKLRVFWPPLPDEPYMEWLGTYSGVDDFEKSASEQVVRDLLGAEGGKAFARPTGIVSDSERGLVYVADGLFANIRVFDFKARNVAFLTEQQLFRYPTGLALDSQKNLYVCDAEAKKVFVMSPRGEVLRVFGQEVLDKPVNLAINERLGRIYVGDVLKSQVAVFDMEGTYLFSIGQEGQAPTDLYAPQGIAIDNEDNVFVADQLNARIQVFDSDGKHLYSFGARGDQYYHFETPRGLSFDSEDNLWVVDARKAAVMVYNKKGEVLLYYAPGMKMAKYPLGLAFPTSIMVDQADKVYLVDAINQRFQVWQFMSQAYKQEHPMTEEGKAAQLRLLRGQ